MFKRLTRLLTPAPFRRTPKPFHVPPSEKEPDHLASVLRPLVERLVTAPTLEDPGAQQSLSEIKQLASGRGPYVTAYEIKNRLDTMPKLDAEGRPYQKPWGYVLAADFFLGHIRKEIAGIGTSPHAVGPHVFKGYCGEMIGCLLDGENVRRGVEVPVLVIDELFAHAIDSFEQSAVYLELAVQAAEATLEQTTQRRAHQTTPPPTKKDHTAEAAPTPPPSAPLSRIDNAVVKYIESINARVGQIHEGLHEYVVSLQSRGKSVQAPSDNVAEQVEHLHGILRIASAAGYLAFCAMVQERIGLALQGVQSGKGIESFRDAGENYEAQGDQERELLLTKLSASRYEKARDQFVRVDDQQRLARVQAKMADIASLRKS